MTDVSYGSLFIKEGISHPYTTPDVKRYVRGSYDENGQWYTMYMLTMALMYNRNMVKTSEVRPMFLRLVMRPPALSISTSIASSTP